MKKIAWLIGILASVDGAVGSANICNRCLAQRYSISVSYENVNLEKVCIPEDSEAKEAALKRWERIKEDMEQNFGSDVLRNEKERALLSWKLDSSYAKGQNPILGAVPYKEEDDNKDLLNNQSGLFTSFIVGIVGKSKRSNKLETWSPIGIIIKYCNNQIEVNNSNPENTTARKKHCWSMSGVEDKKSPSSEIFRKAHSSNESDIRTDNWFYSAHSNCESSNSTRRNNTIPPNNWPPRTRLNSDGSDENGDAPQPSLCLSFWESCSQLMQRMKNCLFPQYSATSTHSESITDRLIQE